MRMIRNVILASAVALGAGAGVAQAQWIAAPPVYVAPAPVYVPPPRPVYVPPPVPVYVPPPVVVGPRYYAPRPYYGYGYGYGRPYYRHHWRRW